MITAFATASVEPCATTEPRRAWRISYGTPAGSAAVAPPAVRTRTESVTSCVARSIGTSRRWFCAVVTVSSATARLMREPAGTSTT